jgi:hypothetical protein
MEMDIISMISTVGFPIVAFLLMFWQSSSTIQQNTKALNELLIFLRK